MYVVCIKCKYKVLLTTNHKGHNKIHSINDTCSGDLTSDKCFLNPPCVFSILNRNIGRPSLSTPNLLC